MARKDSINALREKFYDEIKLARYIKSINPMEVYYNNSGELYDEDYYKFNMSKNKHPKKFVYHTGKLAFTHTIKINTGIKKLTNILNKAQNLKFNGETLTTTIKKRLENYYDIDTILDKKCEKPAKKTTVIKKKSAASIVNMLTTLQVKLNDFDKKSIKTEIKKMIPEVSVYLTTNIEGRAIGDYSYGFNLTDNGGYYFKTQKAAKIGGKRKLAYYIPSRKEAVETFLPQHADFRSEGSFKIYKTCKIANKEILVAFETLDELNEMIKNASKQIPKLIKDINKMVYDYDQLEKNVKNEFKGKKGKKYNKNKIADTYAALVALYREKADQEMKKLLEKTGSKVTLKKVKSLYDKKYKEGKTVKGNLFKNKKTTTDDPENTEDSGSGGSTGKGSGKKKNTSSNGGGGSTGKKTNSKTSNKKKTKVTNVPLSASVLAAYTTEKGKIKNIRDNKINDLKITYNENIDNIKSNADAEKAQAEIDKNNEIAKINQEAEDKINEIDVSSEDAKNQLNQIQAERDEQITAVNQKYEEKINEIDAKTQEQLKEQENNYNEAVAKVKNAAQTSIDKINNAKQASNGKGGLTGVLKDGDTSAVANESGKVSAVTSTTKLAKVAKVDSAPTTEDVSASASEVDSSSASIEGAISDKSSEIASVASENTTDIDVETATDTVVDDSASAVATEVTDTASSTTTTTEYTVDSSNTTVTNTSSGGGENNYSSSGSSNNSGNSYSDSSYSGGSTGNESTVENTVVEDTTPATPEVPDNTTTTGDLEADTGDFDEEGSSTTVIGSSSGGSNKKKGNAAGVVIPAVLGVGAAGAAAVAGVRYAKNRKQNEDIDDDYDDEANDVTYDAETSEYMKDDYLGPAGSEYTDTSSYEVNEEDVVPNSDNYVSTDSLTEDDFEEDLVMKDFNQE